MEGCKTQTEQIPYTLFMEARLFKFRLVGGKHYEFLR